jgi:hypothetical protein
MKTRIQNGYLSIGLEISENKILTELINRIDSPNEILSKQFELFHMDFLIGLKNIQEFDKISFNRYIEKINKTKGNLNFWGEKFETFIHSKLIKACPKIISELKRGADGIEPDILFKYKEEQLGIELTTLKFLNIPKNKEQILSKITEKILEKNNKPYSNEKCALLIDITNIIAYEKLFDLNLNEIFNELFCGFGYLNTKIKYEMVILCNSVFKQKNDGVLRHKLEPRIGFMSEAKTMDKNLKEFLNILFNNFQSDNDFDLKFHHLNM